MFVCIREPKADRPSPAIRGKGLAESPQYVVLRTNPRLHEKLKNRCQVFMKLSRWGLYQGSMDDGAQD